MMNWRRIEMNSTIWTVIVNLGKDLTITSNMQRVTSRCRTTRKVRPRGRSRWIPRLQTTKIETASSYRTCPKMIHWLANRRTVSSVTVSIPNEAATSSSRSEGTRKGDLIRNYKRWSRWLRLRRRWRGRVRTCRISCVQIQRELALIELQSLAIFQWKRHASNSGYPFTIACSAFFS